MSRKIFGLALTALLFAFSVAAHAQQAKKIPTVGFLLEGFVSSVSDSTRIDAFRKRLRELGYMEEKDIIIDYRLRRGKEIASPIWQPNWSVSRWT
jgi:hypothetical protein